jgi:hypothetical protein
VTGVEEGQRIALSVPAGQTLAPAPQLQNASEDSGEDAKASGATTGKPSTGGEGGSSAKEGMKKGGRPTGVGGPEKSASSKDKGEATAPKGSALVQADSEAPAEPSGSQK